MIFEKNVSIIHDLFINAGFATMNEPYSLEQVKEKKHVIDCILIANSKNYEIIYAEMRSNQEGIAADLARAHMTPCLIITRMDQIHGFTIFDHDTSKAVHVRIAKENKKLLGAFIEMISNIAEDQWIANQKVKNCICTIRDYQ